MHLPTSKHRAVRHLLSHLLCLLGILRFFHCGCSPFFQRETRAELSAEMSSATLPAKGLNSRVCSPSFGGCHRWLALLSYRRVALRDQERRQPAIDAHGAKTPFPLACFLQLFLQATVAGRWVKGQNSVLGLAGTVRKISRVIITAQSETEQNINLFFFFPSPHICTLHFY